MNAQYRKRLCCLLLTIAFLCTVATPSLAQKQIQEEKTQEFSFSVQSKLNPEALGNTPSRFIRGLAQALAMLELQGQGLSLGRQVDMNVEVLLNNISTIQAHLQGTEERLQIHSNLFGAEPAILSVPNYIPFLLKFYSYLGVPVQYVGVFTDPYSYFHGLVPTIQLLESLLGGEESRSYSPAECAAIAGQLSEGLDNQDLRFWLQGLLLHFGMDETLDDFFYSLPEWVESITGDEGLQVTVTPEGQTWSLGGTNVYQETIQNGETTWKLALPAWEGYQLTGDGTTVSGETGLSVNMAWQLLVDEDPYASFSLLATNLPDEKQTQGDSAITLSFGGDMFGADETVELGLHWEQQTDEGKTLLKGQLDWLNPDTKQVILTLNGQFSSVDTAKTFVSLPYEEMVGTDLFCMNDETITPFFSAVKKPLIRAVIPLILELPAGFLDGLFDWMEDGGMLQTITESSSGDE